ncbi:MAG: amidase domain-containing protein [Clostridia bacterium]|nr:amidase domain-containing protein [Clostridia bacterium]
MNERLKKQAIGAVCMLLSLFVILLSLPFSPEAGAQDAQDAPDCHEMTELWFGGRAVLSQADGDGAAGAVYAYFGERERDLSGAAKLESDDDITVSDKVEGEREARARGIADMEARADIDVLDAEVTPIIDGEHTEYNDDGSISMYVYEWTFYDYDDLSDGAGGSDVAGHGTYHKITLMPSGEGFEICADEYDESDLYGVCTLPGGPIIMADGEDAAPAENADGAAVLQSTNYYASYDPDAAVRYADKYVYNGAVSSGKLYESYYNKAYANFNDVGGDCANYTSQSIYAGGMPQVRGTAYGTDGWYYVSASDRSGTWTSASRLCEWMGKNRGVLLSANNTNIYKGSPCFHSNKSHATICVGKNSAGTHVLNSHNYDRYHVVWSYISGTVYTVQLTPYDDYTPSSPQPQPEPVHTTHVKGAFQYYGAEHPHYNYYKCSVCGKVFTDRTTRKIASCTECYPPAEEKTRTGYVVGTTGGLEVNSKPWAGYAVGTIPEGAACTVYPDRAVSGWYWVEYRGIGGYAYSGYISFTPPPPTGVWLKADKTELAAGGKVTFTYGANNATGYVMGIDKAGTGRIVTPTLGIATTYEQVFSDPGTYTVYVTAYNNAGSTESGRVSFTVYEPMPAVPVVTLSAEKITTEGSLTVSWTAADNAVRYQYYIGEYPEEYICESPKKSGVTGELSLSCEGLSCGKYTVRVRSLSARGVKSELSAPVSFTVGEPELKPAGKITSNGRTYELFDCETSWTYAESLCESLGGRLAVITDENENEVIRRLVRTGEKEKYFIGASNVSEGDYNNSSAPYAWITGEAFGYSNWAQGEPSVFGVNALKRHFAMTDKTGAWSSTYNTNKYGTGFILEREADSSEIPGMVDITSLEYSDGAVTLTWDAPSDDGKYLVYRRARGEEKWTLLPEAEGTTFTDESVPAGRTYEYALYPGGDADFVPGADEKGRQVQVYLNGAMSDADGAAEYKCLDGVFTFSGDVSEEAPVYAAMYDADGRMTGVKLLRSPGTVDAGGAYRVKLIWMNAGTLSPKSECAEISLK